MKRIQCLTDLNNLAADIPDELVNYLCSEFYSLYEYLSNGEGIKEFHLESYQALVLVEGAKEFNLLMQNQSELEYVEEVKLNTGSCLRTGIYRLGEVQLHYFWVD